MIPHGRWAAALAGQTAQKTFRVAEGNDVVEIVLNIYQDEKTGQSDLPAEDASTAEPTGWAVSATYKSAPDQVIFNRTFPTEREARGAFEDLSKAAAEVEGLIRQEKMQEAQDATAALLQKFSSNSGETPILPSGQS